MTHHFETKELTFKADFLLVVLRTFWHMSPHIVYMYQNNWQNTRSEKTQQGRSVAWEANLLACLIKSSGRGQHPEQLQQRWQRRRRCRRRYHRGG